MLNSALEQAEGMRGADLEGLREEALALRAELLEEELSSSKESAEVALRAALDVAGDEQLPVGNRRGQRAERLPRRAVAHPLHPRPNRSRGMQWEAKAVGRRLQKPCKGFASDRSAFYQDWTHILGPAAAGLEIDHFLFVQTNEITFIRTSN